MTVPLLRLVPLPSAPAPVSRGSVVLMPRYSRMRRSGLLTVLLKVTVTVLAPADAAAMLGE